jgi:histidine ammonia-lyase
MNANLAAILGIEAMTAAQGIECRAPLETSATLQATMERIRAASPALTGDRLMEPDIAAMAELLGGQVLAEGIAADTIAGFAP